MFFGCAFPDAKLESHRSYMQYHIDHCDESKGETYRLAKEFGQQLLDNCREALQENPLYKDGESIARPDKRTPSLIERPVQSPSLLLLRRQSLPREISSTPKSSERMCASSNNTCTVSDLVDAAPDPNSRPIVL